MPEWYEDKNLFSKNYQKRTFVALAKDRLDHTVDRVRSIRTDHYRFVRNFKFYRNVLQPQYWDRELYKKNMHELYSKNKLSKDLKRIYFGERSKEELYDVVIDSAMVHNLAQDSKYKGVLIMHRKSWIVGLQRVIKELSQNERKR